MMEKAKMRGEDGSSPEKNKLTICPCHFSYLDEESCKGDNRNSKCFEII